MISKDSELSVALSVWEFDSSDPGNRSSAIDSRHDRAMMLILRPWELSYPRGVNVSTKLSGNGSLSEFRSCNTI